MTSGTQRFTEHWPTRAWPRHSTDAVFQWRGIAFLCALSVSSSACFESTIEFQERGGLSSAGEKEFEVPSDGFDKTPLPPKLNEPGNLPLTLTRLDPATGPVAGGTQVRVIGSAFSSGAKVFIGGRPVQNADISLLNSNEISIVTPPGQVGPADATVELKGGQTVTLKRGFDYHGLDIVPAEGPTSGGTLVEVQVTGPELVGVELRVGGALCTELEVITPHRLRCRVPPGKQGLADLKLSYGDASGPLLAQGAFTYTNVAASAKGGLSGGSISGNIHVTVVDSMAQMPLPGVWIVVGDDPSTELRGQTNGRGQLTLSAPNLVGPVTLHAALDCFETTSVVSFDAENVVLILSPTGELRCIDDLDAEVAEGSGGGAGGAGGGVGISGSMISGELIFGGPAEFNVNGWDIVPAPRDNEIRVAYVYTTRPTIFSSEVDPGRGDARQRIVEGAKDRGPLGGFPYSIFARPAGLAVYALAGIERVDTGRFVPYVMGIRRNVVTSPGVETTDINIGLGIVLDRSLQVELSQPLASPPTPPTEYRVAAYLDLGGEGVMLRKVGDDAIDKLVSLTSNEPFEFFAQPALEGYLSDLRYTILAGWYSGDYGDYPYTEALAEGVQQGPGAFQIDSLLGIPQAVAPSHGAILPADRTLRWSADGAKADMYVVELSLADGTPLWTQFVPGGSMNAVIPDLSSLNGLRDLPSGFVTWTVRGVRPRGFDYNRLSYSDLRSSNWTHDAIDDFLFEIP